MNKLLQKFTLAFSKAPKDIISIIRAYSKKQHPRSLPVVSKTLLKKIETYKKELQENGLPPFLEIAQVNQFIETGVFLKPTAKALKSRYFHWYLYWRVRTCLRNRDKRQSLRI